MTFARTFAATALVVLATGLAACGESDSDQVKSAVQDYIAALTSGDGAKACELVTEQASKSIASTGQSCAETLKSVAAGDAAEAFKAFDGMTVEKIKITGDKATATIKLKNGATQPASLSKQDGEWKLNTAGVNAGDS